MSITRVGREVRGYLVAEAKFVLNSSESEKAIIAKGLLQIGNEIEELDKKNNFNDKEIFENFLPKILSFFDTAEGTEGKERILALTAKVCAVGMKIRDAAKTAPGSAKKPLSQKIAERNKRALEAFPKKDSTFKGYPFTQQEKSKARESRVPIGSINAFSKETTKFQILSEAKTLYSCSSSTACAMGKREYMEDRSLAVAFTFQANGKTYAADLFGVFDGHGGSKTVDYVKDNLVSRLQDRLQCQLKTQEPNDLGISYALKGTISSLHLDVMHKGFSDGTTAIIGFKLANTDELWTANIGDSSAYLNRNGTAIPMSIEQKPFYLEEGSKPLGAKISYDQPNEYAKQLEKDGVSIYREDSEDASLFHAKEKMTMVYDGSIRNKHFMRLGIPKYTLDMARSIGDPFFHEWKRYTPEIFKQTVQPGDQLIMHSDGVKDPQSVIHAVESDKKAGCSIDETVACLVQSSISNSDNVCVTIVSFGNKSSAKEQFLSELLNGETPGKLKPYFEQLEKTDPAFFTLLSANAYYIEHDAWEKNGKRGSEPGGDNYGKNRMLNFLNEPAKNKDQILNIMLYQKQL
jgi:serine/threonine protein phosphatase PrpC